MQGNITDSTPYTGVLSRGSACGTLYLFLQVTWLAYKIATAWNQATHEMWI